MFKRIIFTLLCVGGLLLAVYFAINSNFYTQEQLNTAREQAILKAREGDYEYALKRLKVLTRYDKKSPDVWYDYLTVLHWAGDDKAALEKLSHIEFNLSPDYFLETCLALVQGENHTPSEQQLQLIFSGLLNNKTYLESSYLERMHQISRESDHEELFLTSLKDKFPDHSLLLKVKLENLVLKARDGNIDQAVALFEVEYPQQKDNPDFIAEYLTVLNWSLQHDRVVLLAADHSFKDLPEYTQLAIADSFQATGNMETSLGYFTSLNEEYPNQEYSDRISKIDALIQKSIRDEIDRKRRLLQEKMAQQKQEEDERNRQLAIKKERWFQNTSFSEINKAIKSNPNSQKYFDRWELMSKVEQKKQGLNRLEIFEQFKKGHPKNSLFYQNYITQLSWDEQYSKSMELYTSLLDEIDGKPYFYEAVAVAARHTDNSDLSLKLYKKLSVDQTENEDIVLGQALALQKLDQSDSVIELLKQVDKQTKNINLLYSLADAYREKSDWGNGLQTLDRILLINPQEQRALQGKAIILIDNNLPFKAFEILVAHPEIIDRETEVAIHSAMNTYSLREASDDSNENTQKLAIEQAKIINSIYIKVLESGTSNKSNLSNAYADRLLLDNLNKSHETVIEKYRAFNESAPDYVLNEVASSLLALKQPRESLEISKKKLANKNDDFSALSNAYYASLDLNDFAQAEIYLKNLDDYIPTWIYSEDGTNSIENPKRETVELMKAMHLAYRNDLSAAQASLENLVSKAPANNEYRTSLATVYRWRGWLELASQELDIVANSDTGYLPREVAISHLLIDKQDFTSADKNIIKLTEKYGNNEAVIQLQKAWELKSLNTVSVSTDFANSKGSNFSSKDANLSVEWYSKPLNAHWRSLAFTNLKYSEFSNTNENVNYTGAGFEYRDTWGDITSKIYYVDAFSEVDFSINGNLRANDFITYNLAAESFSLETPLRAINSNVDAYSISAGIAYQPNELRRFGISTGYMNFSDNNTRKNILLNASQTLLINEKIKLDLFETLFFQANSADTNRNYYNPGELLSGSVGIEYSSNISKFYERSFDHRIRLETGLTKQDSLSSRPVIDLSYLHAWQLSNYLNLNYGVSYRSTYYDGLKETGPRLHFGLGYKF